ncbi:MAG: hypothetical protein LR015_10405 [Verrucomicrobia bacterium]|nr:hypothetical protein [Verrucomicrobiota bacterium]
MNQSADALQKQWKRYLEAFQCELADKEAERMINTWNPYQVERNFQFSRNISYYATGTFRGVGFRDTAQDIMAMIPFDLERSKDKLMQLLGQQYCDGHVNHYFFPTEGWDPVTSIHSDDHLWPILTVYDLIMEEGSLQFLEEPVAWYDGGKASVWQHLQQAIQFTLAHLGERGFPLMLRSDWNDQLFRVCRQGKGESIWTAMQFGTALLRMRELAGLLHDDVAETLYRNVYQQQQQLVNTLGWDGAWFRRAIMDNGLYLGTKDNAEAKLWLNAQTWSVISEMGDLDKCHQAMNSVAEFLDTPLGIKKIHPSITTFPSPEDPLTNYNKGTGENGAIFCHANTWAIIAECMLGRGDRAWKYYRQLIPNVAMQQATPERYKAEPYVYASNLFGPESDKFGLANVSWLTGTAAWMYIAATQYILGIKPRWHGLEVKPCLPTNWQEATVIRMFRGKKMRIKISWQATEITEIA